MVAALFPGQGSQHVGMGKDFFDNFKIAREIFEEASDGLKLNLKKICFDGSESDLSLTENTQPCLLTVSFISYKIAELELGFKPDIVAGHSLGEYTALVAAGSVPLRQAVQWVRERGVAMQKAVSLGDGAMAAILGLEDAGVENLCAKAAALTKSTLVPANYNAPNQLVISGSKTAIEAALNLLKENPEFSKGKAIPLDVSAPFHCPLMEPARQKMAELFSKLEPSEQPGALICPYVPNQTARPTQEKGVILDLLIEQITHPVLWKQSILKMHETGTQTFIEFGPAQVLQGLSKRIAKWLGQPLSTLGCSDSKSLRELKWK